MTLWVVSRLFRSATSLSEQVLIRRPKEGRILLGIAQPKEEMSSTECSSAFPADTAPSQPSSYKYCPNRDMLVGFHLLVAQRLASACQQTGMKTMEYKKTTSGPK